MILVDTNVIINFWKNPTENIHNIFENENIAICGITKSELIHGAKSKREIEIIIEALEDFIMLEIFSKDWLEIGKVLNILKKKGITIPFQDAVIAYLAIKNDTELWTYDKHFSLIQKVIPDLKIYKVLEAHNE